ncbi:unnamed protein product, partial [Effrenium voratum]
MDRLQWEEAHMASGQVGPAGDTFENEEKNSGKDSTELARGAGPGGEVGLWDKGAADQEMAEGGCGGFVSGEKLGRNG